MLYDLCDLAGKGNVDLALEKTELGLLDLYSGCGGMSTGLCFGAHFAGVKLVSASYLIITNYLQMC